MTNKKYSTTLYIPDLHGQYKIWKASILPECQKVDYIVNFGNVVGCDKYSADHDNLGRNQAILSYLRMFTTYSNNWTQLLGPNEILCLNSPKEWTNLKSTTYLRDQWLDEDGIFQVASSSGSRLQTHGGLTYGEWIALDRPQTAQIAAKRLNEKYYGTLFQGPSYRLTGKLNYSANPIWADPLLETYPSWLTAPEDCPFDQIHAENSLNSEYARSQFKIETSPYSSFAKVRLKPYGSLALIGEAEFTGVTLDLLGKTLSKLPSGQRLFIEKEELNN